MKNDIASLVTEESRLKAAISVQYKDARSYYQASRAHLASVQEKIANAKQGALRVLNPLTLLTCRRSLCRSVASPRLPKGGPTWIRLTWRFVSLDILW